MKIMNLLNDIENDEIEDGAIFEVIGDFFYKLIIIDKNLYCINEMTKKLEILDSKYIGRFDNKQYEIIELSNKIEEKKIPKKINNGYTKQSIEDMKEARFNSNDMAKICNRIGWLMENRNELSDKIDEIIDYLRSKGE